MIESIEGNIVLIIIFGFLFFKLLKAHWSHIIIMCYTGAFIWINAGGLQGFLMWCSLYLIFGGLIRATCTYEGR